MRIETREFQSEEKVPEKCNALIVNRFNVTIKTLSDLIEHAVEETWHHGEDCWPQRFQIIHQKSNVALEITDSSSVREDDTLMERDSCLC